VLPIWIQKSCLVAVAAETMLALVATATNHRGRSNTSAPRAGSLGRIQLMIDLGVAAVEQ